MSIILPFIITTSLHVGHAHINPVAIAETAETTIPARI